MRAALVLTLVLFLLSMAGLVLSDNVYRVVDPNVDAALAQTMYGVFQTNGVVPVLKGLLVVSGLGLAIMGVGYGSNRS